ncbi:MAG TPA: endonuclease/exonuclease/phosphatase family protein [Candidatus Nitrosocosmicus sp.]|jgi:endonuclease/exonuclease/phosphatase family metal-dependent hydrolase|nr:endonuclease/exonuclease/phosphatase family protein [Candidatus Nitrosocosmicus sp.]
MFRRRARGTETPSDPHRAVLTVASYNIHKGQGIDGRVDLMRIAAVIEELDADLVGVQEIYRPQAEMLAKRLGVEMHMGVTHTRLEGAYGNAVLTRLPARGSGTFDLTHSLREPRGGIRVDLLLPDGLLHLFNVHFGLRIRERAAQVARLVREHILHADLTGPRVVVGDLNEWFPGAVGRALRQELAGPRNRRTHPSPMPFFALDRIYWDRELHGEGFRVHRSRLARVASDHLPVVARLQLPRRS